MAEPTCAVNSCDRPEHARGWCKAHWTRWRRTGDANPDKPLRLHYEGCRVPGCDRKVNGHGYCGTHYWRWRKTGDVQADVPVRVHVPHDHCTVGSCTRDVYAHGYCVAHYKRWRKTGDPGADRPLRVKYTECTVGGCERKPYGRGLCAMHWNRQRKTGTTRGAEPELIVGDDMRRFWAKTRELPNGCIEWVGGVAQGYGIFKNQGGTQLAHRWLWEQEHGRLDPKTHLDHYRYPQDGCIGPACIRHVRPVTARENSLRGATVPAKNRAKTHCPNGHPYSGTNLVVEKDGSRKCRICCNARAMKYYRQKRPAS